MKKYYIQYIDAISCNKLYAGSANGDGRSYILTPELKDAFEFYGTAIAHISKIMAYRIYSDTYRVDGLCFFPKNQYEIIEAESEPTWFFDMRYYLERFYGLKDYEKIPDGFKVEEGDYVKRPYNIRSIMIYELELNGLKKLVEWAKLNLTPKFKKEPSQLSKIKDRVEKELDKLINKTKSKNKSKITFS